MYAYVAAAILFQEVGGGIWGTAHCRAGARCACDWQLMSTLQLLLGVFLRTLHTNTNDSRNFSSTRPRPRIPSSSLGHQSFSVNLIQEQSNDKMSTLIFFLKLHIATAMNEPQSCPSSFDTAMWKKIPLATCQVSYRCLMEGLCSLMNFPIDGWRSVTMAPMSNPSDSRKWRLLSKPSLSILCLFPTSLLWNNHIYNWHSLQWL